MPDLDADFAILLTDGTVRYWFGTGAGNFLGPVDVSSGGTSPFFMTKQTGPGSLPPLDHIAVANRGSGDLGIIISNGDGTFQPTVTIPARPNVNGITWNFLNNDNFLDIAYDDYTIDSVFVLTGTGLTTYNPAVSYHALSGAFSLASGDFTGDGFIDLAAGSLFTDSVSFLVNNRTGGFLPAVNSRTRISALSVTAKDINNNGLPDLLVGSGGGDSITIFNLQAPSVTPSFLSGNPAAGSPFPLPVITARDSTNIASVELMYRQVGKTAYTSFPLTAGTGTATQRDYSGTLPASALTNRGLEYFYRTSDGFVTASVEPTTIPFRRLRTSIAENAPPTLDRSYQLVSFPFGFTSFANGSASIQIADDITGFGDPNVARLFWWDPVKADTITTDSTSLNGYREFGSSGFPNFEPGRSMFLATVGSKTYDATLGLSTLRNAALYRPTPSGDSVLVEYYVPPVLDSGWNMIATPFAFTIHMDSVPIYVPALGGDIHERTDTVRTNRIGLGGANLRERTASGYIVPNPPLLKPWRGYFLKNNIKQQVFLFYPKQDDNFPATAPPASKALAAGLDWKIDISARSSELEVPPITVGTSKAALSGCDGLDWELPPPMAGDLRLVFQRGKEFGQAGDYLSDIRPSLTETETWGFTVSPGSARAIELSFGGLADIPETYDVILTDVEGRAKQNLRLEPVYRLIASDDRHFNLTVTPKTTGQTALVPTRYELYQNLPNPFNPQTLIKYDLPEAANVRLEVFNILGQKVTTLVNRYEAAGPKSALWDGTDAAGNKVSSGIYFYKLSAGDYIATKKMMLVK
ncbi:MAG: FG-GAP-like repeat-containing protein [Limisphaerales bacterium]